MGSIPEVLALRPSGCPQTFRLLGKHVCCRRLNCEKTGPFALEPVAPFVPACVEDSAVAEEELKPPAQQTTSGWVRSTTALETWDGPNAATQVGARAWCGASANLSASPECRPPSETRAAHVGNTFA